MSPPQKRSIIFLLFEGEEAVEGPWEIGNSPLPLSEIPIAHTGVIFARDGIRLAENRDCRRGAEKLRHPWESGQGRQAKGFPLLPQCT